MTKPVFYVVNKIDGERHEGEVPDFYRLGVPVLYSLSAEHGRGIGYLMDEVMKVFPPTLPEEERVEEGIRVALVGRPNVGKSSLLNKLIGRDRAIVDSTPGTTRDSLDTPFVREGREYIFIDTAGIRRKGKITQRLEKYSAIKALKSLERCDVALVLIDGSLYLTRGAVFSYYEFWQPTVKRLSDEKWQEMLRSDEKPPRPGWTPRFFLDQPSVKPTAVYHYSTGC